MITLSINEAKKTNLLELLPYVEGTERTRLTHEVLQSHSVKPEVARSYLSGYLGNYYRLLAYISTHFENEIILDIGTNTGASALSFAMNRKNKVITFDIIDNFAARFSFGDLPIEFRCCDVRNIEEELLLKAPVIFLDVAHRGPEERTFYIRLCQIGFKGILILDDIHLQKFGDMKGFWNSIKHKKYDLTQHFHQSGTGIVDFSGNLKIIN